MLQNVPGIFDTCAACGKITKEAFSKLKKPEMMKNHAAD